MLRNQNKLYLLKSMKFNTCSFWHAWNSLSVEIAKVDKFNVLWERISTHLQLSRQEFADLVKIVGHEDAGQRLSWLFTALPTILLAILFTLWCVAFTLVILLFPDDAPSKYAWNVLSPWPFRLGGMDSRKLPISRSIAAEKYLRKQRK